MPRLAVQIQRDPFARTTLMRMVYGPGECKECGQRRKTTYSYGWEDDGLRSRAHYTGPFCSVGCYRAYTGQY